MRKLLWPFVAEFMTLIFVILLMFGLTATSIVTFQVNWSVLTVSGCIICGIVFFIYLCRVSRWGILAILDTLLKHTIVIQGRVLSQKPYFASAFADKRGKDGEIRKGFYYVIQVEKEEESMILLASSELLLSNNETYQFRIGRYSSVIIDCTAIPSNEPIAE